MDEITDAFWDLLVCGMGFTDTHIEYDEDPEGKVYGADRLSPREMGWDRRATKRNLGDTRFIFHEKWWPIEEAEERWPSVKSLNLVDTNQGWLDGDEGMDQDDPQDDYGSNSGTSFYDIKRDSVRIVRYQHYEMTAVYLLADPSKEDLVEIDGPKFLRLKKRIDALGWRYVKQMRRKYYQSWMLGPNVLETGDCPCPHAFTLRAMTGKRDEMRNYWYGLMAAMKDPQRWSNKVFNDIKSIMYSNRTGGAFVEEGALPDVRKAEDQWAQENPLIIVNDGAISGGKILERSPMNYPAGLDRLMEFAIQAIPHVTGLNMEMMGMANRDQPGVLEMQRKRAGMTILALLFDSLKRYGKERARVMKYFVEEYISDGRLIKIVGGDGLEKFVPLVKDEKVMKYDIVVSEAPTSPNQKEETFMVMRELLPQMAALGITPPAETIDYLPLPAMLIENWKKQINEAKQNPMAQKMQELEMRLKEGEVKKLEEGAEKDRTQALLNEVKAMVEQVNARLDAKLKPAEAASKIIERSQPTK